MSTLGDKLQRIKRVNGAKLTREKFIHKRADDRTKRYTQIYFWFLLEDLEGVQSIFEWKVYRQVALTPKQWAEFFARGYKNYRPLRETFQEFVLVNVNNASRNHVWHLKNFIGFGVHPVVGD